MEKKLIPSFISIPQEVCFVHYHLMKCAGVMISNAVQSSLHFLKLVMDGKVDRNKLAQKGMQGFVTVNFCARAEYEESIAMIKDYSRQAPLFWSIAGLDIPFPIPILKEFSHFPLISCTVLREPGARFKSLIKYQFRRGILKNKDGLLKDIKINTSKYDNYMTRYFSNIKNVKVGNDDLASAKENVKNIDLVIRQANSEAITNFISCVLTAYQLPNFVSDARINISEQSDIPEDVEESFLDDLSAQYNELDQKFYDTATFKEDVLGVFNKAIAGKKAAFTKNMHPFTCVHETTEGKGEETQASINFGWTDDIVRQA